MKKSFIRFVCILFCFSLSLYGAELTKISLQLQWKYQYEFAGFIMAKELGYYSDVGLDVKIIEFDNSNTIEKLLDKKVDFLLNNSSFLFKDNQLQKTTLLATYLQRSPLIFVTQPNIKSPINLLGKKVMISETELTNSSLSPLLEHYNINKENTTIVKPTYNMKDFIDKKVDAIAVFRSSELFELDKQNIKYKIIDPVEYGFSTNAINLFALEEKVKKNPKLVASFLNATKKGWEYALENRDKVIELIEKKYNRGISIDALEFEAKVVKELMVLNLYDIGEINKEFVHLRYKQLYRSKKVIDEKMPKGLVYGCLEHNNIQLTRAEKNYLKTKKEIKICVDPNWKPLEWIDENGNYLGMGSDYLKLFMDKIGVKKVLYETTSWSDSLKAIKARKCDFLPMAKKTKDREAYLNFTTPYYLASYVIATTNDKFFIDDISLKLDKTFAVVKDYAIVMDLKSRYKGIKIVEVKDIYDGIKAVQKGEVYGFIDTTIAIGYIIQDEELYDIKIAGKLPFGFELSVASRSDEPELNTILQKVINSINQEDKEVIRSKWASVVFEHSLDYTLLYEFLAFIGLIFLAFIYRHIVLKKINSSLSKKVKDKTIELMNLNEKLEKKVQQRTKALSYQAYHDSLTGLPNRTLFHDRLEQSIIKAKRIKSEIAIFFIDLDGFKHINDSLGHDIGDEVLKMTSKRLRDVLREGDTLSRLGGDEFTVIIENLNDTQNTSLIANKILKSLVEPMEINSQILYISASIGISLYPKDDTDVKNLIKYADTAMYKAKDEGKNNFQFYSSEMTVLEFEKVMMRSNIRKAIDNKEFEVYYQPQVDALNNKLVGMEALVRWIHPVDGMISPAKFIPLAEETGLIIGIDQFVMSSAMAQVSRWHKDGLKFGTLSLNLAIKHLEMKDYIKILKEKMDRYDFKADWLELEVTEGDVMKKPDEAIRKLNEINSLGIKIAIDDFGTGYSSLSYLKRLPIDKLKIDQSFVRDIPNDEDDSAIVKAVIALGDALNLKLIAEGVEEKEQKEFLISNGCINIQGYYYSKPINSSEMEKYIESYQ